MPTNNEILNNVHYLPEIVGNRVEIRRAIVRCRYDTAALVEVEDDSGGHFACINLSRLHATESSARRAAARVLFELTQDLKDEIQSQESTSSNLKKEGR